MRCLGQKLKLFARIGVLEGLMTVGKRSEGCRVEIGLFWLESSRLLLETSFWSGSETSLAKVLLIELNLSVTAWIIASKGWQVEIEMCIVVGLVWFKIHDGKGL